MTPEDARAPAPLTWAEIDDWRRYQADERVVAALDAGEQMAAVLEDHRYCCEGLKIALAAWRRAVAAK